MYDEQPAVAGQGELPLRDEDHADGGRQVLIVGPVLLIPALGDEHVGERIAALELEETLEVMGLIPPDAQPLHQVEDQPVVVLPDLVAAVPLRRKVAGDAELVRVVEVDAGLVVHHALGDHDVGQQALLAPAVEMNKAAHGVEQSPGNGETQAQASGEAAAAGVRLIEDVVHLPQLVVRHADAGVPDVHHQIDAVALPAVSDADVDAALLGKLDGVLHQDFQHVGDLLRVPHQDGRQLGVDVEHQLQVVPVALEGGHGDDIVEHRGNHIPLFGRRQSALHDLRVVQHVVDLVGQPLARQLDGVHVPPDIRRKLLPQGHLTDADDHIDGGAELVGYIR